MEKISEIFRNSKLSANILKNISSNQRTLAIENISILLDQMRESIIKANEIDIENAKKILMSDALIDRLILNNKRIDDMIVSTKQIANQPDPVGIVLGGHVKENGLKITKIRVPLGVVGIIYESRPNVTVDCAALCLRSGNAAVLRGGKEAINTNNILAEVIKKAITQASLPLHSVVLLDDPDRSKLNLMLKAKNYIDLIIPRGGEGLINYVTENSLVPVVKHDKGVCYTYVDEFADFDKALNILLNAKLSKPSACNALEGVLVHQKIANRFIPVLHELFKKNNIKLKGCQRSVTISEMEKAGDDDWGNEYLALTASLKIVDDIQDAVEHITNYSSHHSDAIITENYTNAQYFLDYIDSACVYINASTRFTDGGEFGLGAEVGISTQKLHSRGPMGAFDLTTTKYLIYGDGQIR